LSRVPIRLYSASAVLSFSLVKASLAAIAGAAAGVLVAATGLVAGVSRHPAAGGIDGAGGGGGSAARELPDRPGSTGPALSSTPRSTRCCAISACGGPATGRAWPWPLAAASRSDSFTN
jgi:hypothetical protein